MADGAKELVIPVSGGNVSFYNQTGSEAILPTPVVGVLGVIDDVRESVHNKLGTVSGTEELYLLGQTFDEFGGSIWQQVSGAGLSGLPPRVDLANEEKLMEFFQQPGVVSAAHDVSEGGVAQAIAELAIYSNKGVSLDVSGVHDDVFTALFSESAQELGIPVVKIGETIDEPVVRVEGQFEVPVAELTRAWTETLPRLFSHAVGANSVV